MQKGASAKGFKPFVPDTASVPEFTIKAILLGAFFAVLFGAATVYLALRAGVTVSASIPIAVLSIAVFKKVGSTILENNIVQTIGSAGESVAAGVVFTVTGFLFLSAGAGGDRFFRYWPIMILSLAGGFLGVLMMIPLRRSLIVQEHGNLTYPEGTACAEVLVAGEKGGAMARLVFRGLWTAMIYKAFNTVLAFFKEIPSYVTGKAAALPNATVNCEIVPEYLGVGYIIGPRVAGIMVSGSILGWMALTPLLSMFVSEQQLHAQLRSLSFSDAWIASHGLNEQFYRGYIRLIGAGAVAMAGIMSLARTLPTIYASFRDSVKSLRAGGKGAAGTRRTERDIPINVVAIGSLILALAIALFMPGLPTHFPKSLLLALLIIAFGFFFVTVSSRIVGIIGTTSNPISGMTIATIMGTCMLFIVVGWSGNAYQTAALVIGAIVSIAAANAGATSQDLKTGYIVGATPWRQQVGFIIGVFASAFAVGGTLFLMHHAPGFGPIGSDKLPAPQGTLMATLIQGILGQKLQWGFVFVGAGLAVAIQVMGISALAWAVGAYLPLSTTMPIFVGGVVRFIVEKMTGREESESEVSSGMLYSTGLVAGGSVAGVLIAGMSMIEWNHHEMDLLKWIQNHSGHLVQLQGKYANLVAVIVFAGLCYLQFRNGRRKIDEIES
ncbi:MAG TPA: oligopeptide transporter, OPT family [Candidatus Polarisedimenticolia bacterium]|nr:oligopeptide transporter, OPT family [Candidatus Polarisedimenticolia bacterium]